MVENDWLAIRNEEEREENTIEMRPEDRAETAEPKQTEQSS